MPRLTPSELAALEPRPQRLWYLLVFFALFAAPLFLVHLQLFDLPYFWDELGQFVPTALDLLRHGWWVPKSAVPNVHPPGVELYLVFWYKLFGYSIAITRVAMLTMGACGLLLTFLLAIELSRGARGAPAFWPPLFLLASPLFFMQSFLAQLDMPAMVFTLLAVWLFLKGRIWQAALASVCLVLTKETGLVTPFVFFLILLGRRDWRRAFFFAAPAAALGIWLVVLHRATGYWLGDPHFAHYNVGYSLKPVRIVFSLLRRLFYLFIAEFRWIGAAAIVYVWRKTALFRNPAWLVAVAVTVSNVVLVSVLGGAELERYLLPVMPFFYIAAAIAFASLPKWMGSAAIAATIAGLVFCIFWNPPYPFPYENNYAMVDFVRLQKLAADFADSNLDNNRIATAWPYSAALRRPDYGFVKRRHLVIETTDFHARSIERIAPSSYDALITYTRTWAPENGAVSIPWVRNLLARFYDWEPDISEADCNRLGLREKVSWSLHGQTITIYLWRQPRS